MDGCTIDLTYFILSNFVLTQTDIDTVKNRFKNLYPFSVHCPCILRHTLPPVQPENLALEHALKMKE